MKWRFTSFIVVAMIVLVGCDRPEVTSYRIPKEDRMAQARRQLAAMQGESPSTSLTGSSEVSWSAPKSWVEQPASAMRKGSFLVKGNGAQQADMSIVTFPGDAGGDLANINRWRGQLQLSPVQSITKDLATNETFGAGEFLVLNFSGSSKRMLAAILHQENQTWFFKLMGDDELVQGQQKNFYSFLKSVKMGSGNRQPISAEADSEQDPHPKASIESPPPSSLVWKIPHGWVQQPNSPMRVGSFAVNGKNGEKADISLIDMPGTAGGVSANIEMWREQLELPKDDSKKLDDTGSPFDIPLGKGTLVELKSEKPILEGKEKARMIVAIVPHGEQTWFFKIVGNDSLVSEQKKTFLDFLNSLRPFEGKSK